MKINYVKLALLCISISSLTTFGCYAKENQIELREIIGSGFFDVNKTRKFLIDENTRIYHDQIEIDYEHFEIIGSGFKSTFTINKDVGNTIESGTINAIELTTNLSGPVTSINPLMILEQAVLETSDTVKAYPNKLLLNQNISVSGYLNRNNSLKATRIMPNSGDWKIRGLASNVNELDFTIGSLQINRGTEQILDCQNGLNNDDLVEVKMASDLNYKIGFPIDTIVSIRCLLRNQLANEELILPSVIQGYVSQIQGQNFWLDDVKINVDQMTQFVNGEFNFINDAVNVEIQGTFDTITSELNAESIRFIDSRIEITFPVQPEDIVGGESVTIMEQKFYKTPQTKDNAGIFSTGIFQPKQIEIQGYVDSEGKAYLTKTIDKGVPNLNIVSLRGNISALSNPELTVLNFDIDASQSQIIKPGTGNIDINTFFDEIKEGSQIDIKNAKFNNMNHKFSEGKITLRRGNPQPQIKNSSNVESREIIGSGFFSAYVTATITATADQLFITGFE